ncbi:S8 family serine peptidase [Flavobacterium sp.]|uniref:S8 family serine peptidase n=1 Tax=Flavobacterium sp. TaxID=239 RepID=UPI0028BE34A9|nr:S8 family serine peptidase [Flavobacterium sp.]
MKIKLLVVALLGVCSVFGQNIDEQKKIIRTYDLAKSKELLDKFNVDELVRKQRVETYLVANPGLKQDFFKEGVRYRIVDILEGKPLFIATENAAAARSVRANTLYAGGSMGLSLDGSGITVGVWDGGWVLRSHNEFMISGVSKVTTPDAVGVPAADFHPTHVAGTIGARGATPSAKGMAPASLIKSFDWTADLGEVNNHVTEFGLMISNHSYGTPYDPELPVWYMGAYSTVARDWDEFTYNHQYYLPVMSAGNEGGTSYTGGLANGYDKLTGNKNAKNSLIVANANPSVHVITGVMTSLVINPGSSQGPSDDGRIKPDIAGDGTNLYSTSYETTTSYGTASGTSMASPNVSGTIALLQQHYNNLHPSEFMRASTVKALVCHTALDDAASVGPDPKFGYGLLDAREAATVLNNSVNTTQTAIVNELNLSQGGTYTFNVAVNSPKKLKATICWTDAPGASQNGQLNSSIPALVNDLDVRVIKNAEVYYPWKLQLSDVSAPAIKGDNLVDNVEKVEVDDAIGTYTVQVTHKGALLNGSQNYSLVISGFDQTVLSQSDFVMGKVSVYPNPASDILNIEGGDAVFVKYELHDVQGRLIKSEKLSNQSNFTIDTSSLTQGVYLLNLISEKGNHLEKIVKK